ncbi:MAG: carboxypeptidase regulatory-like domain-containing protein [Candidatus Syntrophosphaera sp.]|nr:carboxypeptidase regulatory-like domain-containing protein [Candidatus Syntrophosphaera sp.]
MKKAVLIPALMLLMALAHGYPVLIRSWNPQADAKTLSQMNISVVNVNRQSGSITAYVRGNEEFEELLDHGFQAAKLPDEARENALRLHSQDPGSAPRDEYYTIDQYHQFMVDTAAQYPNICQLVQVGTSIQNRPLYFLKITDNPALEEAEPEFKYISSMHGNEVVGYDMCIRLIQLLTSEYGTDARITDLVNSTEIWICPMMNPDGFVLGQRYNAAGVDLNRNFPMPTGNQHPDGNAWAPENIAVMDFCNDQSFVLSANFHTGALVMNYPWDYTYNLTPDDALIQAAALSYSIHNLPMYNSTEFPNGITNGAEWYVITGSMQDWNYGYTDCIDITAEISNSFWPPASTLPTYWAQNQESMLSYLEFVHKGVHGLVTSSSGTPLDAKITVQGNAKAMHTDPDVGDFHRLLLPGSYTITAESYGYLPQTAQITVPASGSTSHNFVLEHAVSVNLRGQARDPEGYPLAGLEVALLAETPITANTDALGNFQINGIYEGNYQISFSQAGAVIWETSFLLTRDETRRIFVISDPLELFSDPCETIGNWTATPPWGVSTYQGESVITDSPGGNYANRISKPLLLTNPISLQNIENPVLTFRTAYALENGYDFVYVQASNTTSNWTTLGSITGTQLSWQDMSFSLAQFAGQSVHVRFLIVTDYSVTADGIYLDDITIKGIDSTELIYGDADGNRQLTKADGLSILAYSIGLDPLPDIDPRPWSAERIAACDLDADQSIDAFDAWLLFNYIGEAGWRLPVQTDVPENPGDPVLTAHYNGVLVIDLEHPELLKSISFSTSPVNVVQISHVGTLHDDLYGQFFNADEDRYGYAGHAVQHLSLTVTLEDDPSDFTLQYSLNGVPGSVFISTSAAGDDPLVPVPVFSLAQNHPNPFNPSTRITISLAKAHQTAHLRIYNAKGQLVKTLLSGIQPAGVQNLVWDGRDDFGKPVSSGIYLYRLESGGESLTRKMILLK